MARGIVLGLAMLGFSLQPLKVSDQIDLATQQRMQQREQQLSWEMTWLQQEVVHTMEEPQNRLFRTDMPFTTWEMGLFGAFAGALMLLFGLFCMSMQQDFDDGSSDESTSSSEEEEEDLANEWGEERLLEQINQWPVQCLAKRSKVVQALVEDLLHACHLLTSKTLLPRLEPCIGVGSAFEGWSSDHDTTVYNLLVPLKPPTGHSFHLELGTGGELLDRHGRVRVQLECVCQREQLLGYALCFLHHPEVKLGRHEGPDFLQYLCTHSYLDVEKTSCWLQLVVMNAWLLLPPSHRCKLRLLPASRSCKLRLTSASGRPLFIDILLGVQQGDSRIYLTSQEAEAGLTSSTMWLESCAVLEVLFFRVMARQAPRGSCHLECLQLFAHLVRGTSFSSYCLKTVVMHLLTTIPLSSWHRAHMVERLNDILHYLHRCLERKQLHHFLLGNKRVPAELLLPPAFQTASPPNLFQHMAQEQDAHAQALRDFGKLQDHLQSLLERP
ncbi:inositol 1,4,5-trisphosphate receptor-interacting protein-like 1 [Dromaius novaehollandiae]|uniref:inositol 1,4,5-trisphosphate receptor-interacting protein-like 1 n=1 Tax=Dromaius novaehollandiae TaxID=8790 RepID=UPI00311EB579